MGFGKALVGQGNKSIKLKADPPRLAADIVVCMEYRRYTSYNSYAPGISFYALQDKRWVVNYPKLHYNNGAQKSTRTWDRYKRTVRMFKTARNCLEDSKARLGPTSLRPISSSAFSTTRRIGRIKADFRILTVR